MKTKPAKQYWDCINHIAFCVGGTCEKYRHIQKGMYKKAFRFWNARFTKLIDFNNCGKHFLDRFNLSENVFLLHIPTTEFLKTLLAVTPLCI